MPNYGTGRTPRQVYGHAQATDTQSVRAWTADGPAVSMAVWQLWERAARTIYSPGEPVELTRVRDELESWRDVARDQYRQGYPAILQPHVMHALRIAGWVQ